MLLVKTSVRPSPLNGMGLFAEEFIPKGTIIWEFNPLVDKILTERELRTLPEVAQDAYRHYSHFSKKTGGHTLSFDNDRFINHAEEPNTEDIDTGNAELATVAACDIQKGEEITCNYYAFYTKEDAERKLNQSA